MNKELKLGDIVRCISNKSIDDKCKGKIGKIIYIDKDIFLPPYVVEFFKYVHGHNGLGIGSLEKGFGEYGNCWNFDEDEMELYQPILKIFLKEKNNEKR